MVNYRRATEGPLLNSRL